MTRVSAREKVSRDTQIVADRARGLPWNTIAQRHELTVRQCQKIWRERPDGTVEIENPIKVVADFLAGLDAVIEDYALLAEQTSNESVRLGAIKARMSAIDRRFIFMRATGLMPRDLGVVRQELEIVEISKKLLELMKSHNVPVELLAEVVDEPASGRFLPTGSKHATIVQSTY